MRLWLKRAGREYEKNDTESTAKHIRRQQAENGFTMTRLSIVKGRDGTQRGNIDLKFHFERNAFTEDDGA